MKQTQIPITECIKLIKEGNIYLPGTHNTVYLASFLIPYNYTKIDVGIIFSQLENNKASLLMLPHKSFKRFLTKEQSVKVLNTGLFDFEEVFTPKMITRQLIKEVRDGVYGELSPIFLERFIYKMPKKLK